MIRLSTPPNVVGPEVAKPGRAYGALRWGPKRGVDTTIVPMAGMTQAIPRCRPEPRKAKSGPRMAADWGEARCKTTVKGGVRKDGAQPKAYSRLFTSLDVPAKAAWKVEAERIVAERQQRQAALRALREGKANAPAPAKAGVSAASVVSAHVARVKMGGVL